MACPSEPDAALATAVAERLSAHTALIAAVDPADRPLIVTALNDGGAEWAKQVRRLARWGAGTTFALVQVPDALDPADIAGAVRAVTAGEVRTVLAAALTEVAPACDVEETAGLAANPRAPWRRREAGQAA